MFSVSQDSVAQGLSTSSPEKKEYIKNLVLNETKEYFVGLGPDSPKTDVTLSEERHLGEDNEGERREEEFLSSEPEVGVECFYLFFVTFAAYLLSVRVLHYHRI